MSDAFSAVSCSIECYPFEGGPYFIRSGDGLVRSVTVTKSLSGGADGRFSIQLAPGGPFGTESSPDWTEVVTPGSHVLIGMARGADAAIVMDGVATATAEDQKWQSSLEGESTAMRSPSIAGSDFAWFFNTQNWYSLAMYGLVAGTGLGGQLGFLPSSIIPILSQGLVNGTPAQVGHTWFSKIMAASGGLLGSTFVPYQGGASRLPFNTLISETIEQYPGVYIPYTEQFLGLESWMAKFMDIFPWPWYEFFVATAPSGTYALMQQPSGAASGGVSFSGNSFIVDVVAKRTDIVASGTVFTMKDFPAALPAGPQMVARVTPIPRFDFVPGQASSDISVGQMAMDRWNALPTTSLSGYGFYESNVSFSSDEAKNFYMLNPTAYQTMFGDNGSNVVPFPFVFMGAADPASVHRYGYRPAVGTTRWFYDWNGLAAQKQASGGGVDIRQTVATLTAALASWWHPLPLMARAQVAIPLSPSIYIGTKFEYAPFKDGIKWTFYVETVEHRYVYGGTSTTTLTLCRGLPSSVYADSGSDGLLRAIYTGNARRQYVPGSSGIYHAGLPSGTGQGLQVFSSPTTAASLAQQMWTGFVTPQASGQ